MQKWLVFVAVGIMAVLIDLDMTIVNLAVPSIAQEFLAALSQMQWVVSIYSFAAIGMMLPCGKLADEVLGKKCIYTSGVLLFLAGSTLALFANDCNWLIFARAVQGIGFGSTIALGAVILTQTFPKATQGLVIGLYMTLMGIAQALGPAIGGWILNVFGWRLIFGLNLPFCAISLFLFSYYKEEPFNARPFNWRVFDLSSCMNASLAWMIFVRGINMYIWGAILFLTPCYLQNILGLTTTASSMVLICMTAIFTVTAPIIGKLTDRFGSVRPILIALGISIVSICGLIFSQQLNLWGLVFFLSLTGLSTGIMATASVKFVNTVSSADKMSQAMGIFYSFMLIGFSLGIATSSKFLSLRSSYVLKQRVMDLPQIVFEPLTKVAQGIYPLSSLENDPLLKSIASQSFYSGLQTALIACLVLNIASLLISNHRQIRNRLSLIME